MEKVILQIRRRVVYPPHLLVFSMNIKNNEDWYKNCTDMLIIIVGAGMKFRTKSLRLNSYDYSQNGLYFITICVNQQLCLFGEVIDKKLNMNGAGKMIAKSFIEITKYYNGFDVDSYIVMPDHFHGILIINNKNVGAPPCGRPIIMNPNIHQNSILTTNLTLGEIVGRFKSITTYRYINGVEKYQWKPFYEKLWQRVSRKKNSFKFNSKSVENKY